MSDPFLQTPVGQAVTVSQLNRRVRTLLEQGIAKLWVEGELSNLARPASGHLYFSLKDANAQIRAAFFRQRQREPTSGLKNGDRVLIFGRVSVYEPRGDYQLIVERLEAAGEGALKRAFDRLQRKLADEGLFDQERKRPLPALPARIGVVTSPSGAAIRDVLTVLARRFPAIPVLVYPAAVQGDAAPAALIAALETANRRAECDVLILGRGGGSLEDLWAFNDEALARAIHASVIPVVAAVGHEVDVTIADWVADVRAPTPSGAAELVVPDAAVWLRQFAAQETRLVRLAGRVLEERGQTLDWLGRRLRQQSPRATLARQAKSLADLKSRLAGAARTGVLRRRAELRGLASALYRMSPALRLERLRSRLAHAADRLESRIVRLVEARRHRLRLAARALDTVSPLATLGRGYAIVSAADSGRLVRRAADVAAGDAIEARVAAGRIAATVTAIREE